MRDVRRVGAAAIVAMVFGVVMSVIKGNGAGIRTIIGNAVAPWLILAFIGGAVAGGRSVRRAAAVGLLVSLAGLSGFYLANTFVLDLGPHAWLTDLRLTFDAGRRYFELAVLSGPVFGVVGGWRVRARSAAVGVGVAALLVFEPFAQMIYYPPQGGNFADYLVVGAVELVAGIALGIAAWTVGRSAISWSSSPP